MLITDVVSETKGNKERWPGKNRDVHGLSSAVMLVMCPHVEASSIPAWSD
jgi:hypothetical protein